MITLLLFISLQFAHAGQEAGSGGDTVECVASSDNAFNGTYALDYLLTYKESIQNSDIVKIKSLDDSFKRIQKNLAEKVPELLENYNEFIKLVRNEDVSLPRFWEEAPFGLVDIKDEEIINLVPMNCRQDGQVKIVQTVIRLNPTKNGTKKYRLIYRYVPRIFQHLIDHDPLQLSFLLVHEWLWDLSHNVEQNRRLNRLLHSKELDELTREQLRTKITTIGFDIPETVSPVFGFDSCLADVQSAKMLMNRIAQGQPNVISKTISFMKRSLACPRDGIDGCLYTQNPTLIPLNEHIEVIGQVDQHGKKSVYFRNRLIGSRLCSVDESTATIDCSQTGSKFGIYGWFTPAGTIGKNCIRLYDSSFYRGSFDPANPNRNTPGELTELVMMITTD